MPTDTTPKLNLPLIAAQQAQKHVTHNEALRALDALVQATVKDRDLASPPASPQEGDCYIVAAGATGDWAVQENAIAEYRNGGWVFHAPAPGWLAFAEDEAAFLFFDGSAWQNLSAAITALQNLLKLGINTTADDTNRLAVKSDAVLFSHDDVTPGTGDVRFKVNKASATNTASLLFQDNWSGRAEIGLAGNDDLSVKVSADGNTWKTSLTLRGSDGGVEIPQGIAYFGSRCQWLQVPSGDVDILMKADNNVIRRLLKLHRNGEGIVIGRVGRTVGAGWGWWEIGGPNGSWTCNVQDGTGRVNFRWNANGGLSPKFTVSGDRAVEWDIDGYGSMGMTVRISQPNPGAGQLVQWNNLWAIGLTGMKAWVPVILPGHSKNALPSAAGRAGALIYVSDEAGGPTVAFSDGTNWRRVQDRAIVR